MVRWRWTLQKPDQGFRPMAWDVVGPLFLLVSIQCRLSIAFTERTAVPCRSTLKM